MSRLLLLLALALGLAACPSIEKREICANGLDDDKNGLTDCDDPDCAGQNNCPVLYWGPCAKCGKACTTQSGCVDQGFSYDAPLPFCLDARCQQLTGYVEVGMQFDTTAWTGAQNPGAVALRFISKKAVDGSAVTCGTVAAAAPGTTAADAAQIETSGKFQELGFDVRKPNNNSSFAPNFNVSLVKVGIGSDYLIWVEVWGGVPDPSTKLPRGTRHWAQCYADAAITAPIVPSDNCPSTTNDAGTCRWFELMLNAPP